MANMSGRAPSNFVAVLGKNALSPKISGNKSMHFVLYRNADLTSLFLSTLKCSTYNLFSFANSLLFYLCMCLTRCHCRFSSARISLQRSSTWGLQYFISLLYFNYTVRHDGFVSIYGNVWFDADECQIKQFEHVGNHCGLFLTNFLKFL